MEIYGLFSVQILVLVALLPNGCDGFCFVGNLMAEMTVSRRLRYYCEYTGTDGHSLKLFPGSNMYLVDQCLDCKCTMDGLQCCGFGYAGGTMAIQKDCKLLLDGCHPMIVKSDNQTLDCFTGKPINFTSLFEQLPHPDNTYQSLNILKPIPSTSAPVPAITTTASPTTARSTPLTPTTTASPTTARSTPLTPTTTASPTTAQNKTLSTTTKATPITAQTTTTKQAGVDGILAPTMADYFHFLMQARSSNHSSQYWDTGNIFQSPTPKTAQTVPATTATTVSPITSKTTTPNPGPVGQDDILVPTMADYFRFLMQTRSSNQAHSSQYWDTGNTFQSPSPVTAQPVPATTTTTASPITSKTTTPQPGPVGQDAILVPTMADYFRFLMLERSSTPNQAHSPPFLQYLNTGNTLQSLAPAPQPPPPINNLWQYDNFLPWFLFI